MVSTPNFTDGTWRIVSTGHHGGTPNGDILWQNVLDQSLVLWRQDGSMTVSKSTLPGLEGYEAVATGDFDGDGVEDVFLRNETTDDNQIILGGSNSRENTANSLWVPEAAADLDGDGKDDIVLVSPDGTMLAGRLMNGTTVVSQTNFASGYVADDQLLAIYNGEDADTFDSLWFDQSLNRFDITSYNNGVRTVTDSFTVEAGNEYVRTGDFDGDGNPDHLFRDSAGSDAGSIEIVFTNGSFDTGRVVYQSDFFPDLHFEDAGDFDDDGITEVLARDPVSGETKIMQAIGGNGGNQTLQGSDTDDLIDGQDGDDKIDAGDGDDVVLGADGNDLIRTGDGDDRAAGGPDDDTILGGQGEDELQGHAHDDDLFGGAGDDTLDGGSGTDIQFGGDGDDYLVGGSFGFDHIRGGAGDDLIRGGSTRSQLEGNDGDDAIYGGNNNDVIRGGDGDDYLVGGGNPDTIYGGAGDDIIVGEDRAGTSAAPDVAYGGAGSDYFYLGNDDVNYYTGPSALTIKDYDAFGSETDYLMLNGTAADYNFVDTGPTIEVRQASDGDVLAVIETSATTAQIEATAIYMG